ncbi:MAG: hypothetical protein AB7F35_10210 [Acetobacteraceae bacterium]
MRGLLGLTAVLLVLHGGAWAQCTGDAQTSLDCVGLSNGLAADGAVRLAFDPPPNRKRAEPPADRRRPDTPPPAANDAVFNVLARDWLASNGLDDTLRIRSRGRYGIEPSGHAEVSVKYLPAYSGGKKGVVQNAFRVTTQVAGAPDDNQWANLALLEYGGTGGTGQHVATYAQANRRSFAPGGKANNPEIWASTFESNDMTGQPSSRTGAQMTAELDLAANDADDADRRAVMVLWAKRFRPTGPNAEFLTALSIVTEGWNTPASVHQATLKSAIQIWANFSQAAFDTRRATQQPNANAIWLRTGHAMAFDTAGPGGAAVAKLSSDGSALSATVPIAAAPGTKGAQVVNFSQFAPENAPNGSTKLPGGLLLQWGNAATAAGGSATVRYPAAFARQVYSVTLTPRDRGGQPVSMNVAPRATDGFTAYAANAAGQGVAAGFFWMAIGH